MTDTAVPLSTPAAIPSQTLPAPPVGSTVKDESPAKAEGGEEEPYTIKCICAFSDDDGNTIYCEACDTWQHIDCFYPNNREEAIREDFSHACADCNPRPLDRKKAIERTFRLTHAPVGDAGEKKTKRPPSKSHKKKPKPADVLTNGASGPNGMAEHVKHGSPTDNPAAKKPKSLHKASHSVGSHKRSPSYANHKPNSLHPPSPATTPPDLPDNFYIHTYTPGFRSLYDEQSVNDTQNNAFSSLAIPTALSRWLRDPETMQQEVGRSAEEVFQTMPPLIEAKKPKLEIEDATRTVVSTVESSEITIRWRFMKSTTPIDKDVPLIELNGVVGFQAAYCADTENLWADLSSPLPFVFFHPSLPLCIDTRKEGSLARYVRRSCKPNAQLDTYLSGSDYHFWLVSDRHIPGNEQITLPWDFRLDKSVGSRWLHLLGLSDEDSPTIEDTEPEIQLDEYNAISNWIDRILSEYGGCACDLDNNCAFARFHRQWLFLKDRAERSQAVLKSKKTRKQRAHTISPTSTGHATNSRAASEGQPDDGQDNDAVSQSGSSRSKPPSRDPTPLRQGSLDKPGILTELTDREKRKVAMVEDSFRRMEQQQPPRKKKRVSDGTTTSNSSKPKSRNGSVAPPGQYVDAGTSRRESGSPASARSPDMTNGYKATLPRHEGMSSHVRPRMTGAYCDAGVQTDPVQGEWFSGPPRPRVSKRIISLSRRLLGSKHRAQIDEELRQSQAQSMPTPVSTAMELDSPTEQKSTLHLLGDLTESPNAAQSVDTQMSDAGVELSPASPKTDADKPNIKTPDLRVQMPPVPAFDNTGLTATPPVATPLSTASPMPQSPFSTSLTNPFAALGMNSISTQPSPAKKKLSLSDYTKSRMNKAAGKVAGGSAILKPHMATPDEAKVDIIIDTATPKSDVNVAVTPTTTNGIS